MTKLDNHCGRGYPMGNREDSVTIRFADKHDFNGCVAVLPEYWRTASVLARLGHQLYGSHVAVTPSMEMGEPLSAEDRAACIADLKSGDIVRAQNASMALADDRSPEVLEGLLEALAKGAWSVPDSLLRFVTDPRVRPALVEALERYAPDRLANVAQAVGLAGGTGAQDALRRRLADLLDDSRTFDEAQFTNWLAFSAIYVAHALLRLDPEAIDAAHALVKLMDHPCKSDRTRAESVAAEVICDRRYDRTEPVLLLQSELLRRFDQHPGEVSINTLTALLRSARDRARAECERRLNDPDLTTRHSLWQELTESGNAWAAMIAAGAPPRWVAEPADPETLFFCIQLLGPLVPRPLAERVIRERLASESPGVRDSAIGALASVDPALARKLAREALRDEPDPALHRKLATHASWSPPRRQAPRRPARGRAARKRPR